MQAKIRTRCPRAMLAKSRFRLTLIGVSLLTFCQVGRAQQAAEETDRLRGDISTLKKDVNTLEEELRRISDQLNELKHSRLASTSAQPVSQTPTQPTDLHVYGELYRGKNTANLAIIEYSDFECPYCGEYERTTFPQLLTDYIETGKVKYFYRDLPLPMHARAMPAARAAYCAGEQGKYWEMHDSLFAKQIALSAPALLDRAHTLGLDAAKFEECFSSDKYDEDLRNSVSGAQTLGIEGTPTFFIGTIEGDIVKITKAIQGGPPFAVFKSSLDALLDSKRLDKVSPQ